MMSLIMLILMYMLFNMNLYIYLMINFMSLIMLILMKFNYYLNNWGYIYYFLGVDKYSLGLVILMIWIVKLMFIASKDIYMNNKFIKFFKFNLLFMMISLLISFFSLNLFIFYLFFEISLIPIFFLIIGWGYQPERIQASMYMFIYTLIVSLPMLMMMMKFYYMNYTLMFNLIYMMKLIYLFKLSVLFMMMIFLVKIPMFLVHLWLPKAHVEAPISGSMILAAIMLKLGTYGILRIMMIIEDYINGFNLYIILISLIGAIYLSLVCMSQVDLKMLIAYSSVVHMGLLLSGMLTYSIWGLKGSYYIMLGHGLCSSGLFYLVNLNYERLYSRNIMLNKGMMNLMINLTLWWFLLCSSNMSAPPSLNLLGEIMLIISLVSWNKNFIYLVILFMFFSMLYSLYLYSYTQHGKNLSNLGMFMNIKVSEYLVMLSHWIPLNILFIFINKIV
uniref:NADH-ubiquinone oxidoreductase chain 4 n=1 Tax=Aulacus sinensis TaxID=2491146 RepID=A0A3S8V0D1_9HYME|nr:NADH dehydrogenase subunit 4 [Aulacus sinensis]